MNNGHISGCTIENQCVLVIGSDGDELRALGDIDDADDFTTLDIQDANVRPAGASNKEVSRVARHRHNSRITAGEHRLLNLQNAIGENDGDSVHALAGYKQLPGIRIEAKVLGFHGERQVGNDLQVRDGQSR